MSKVIRWGIVGCGDVTERKSGPALQQARDSELVAVMRRDPDKARDYAQRHGVARWYADADRLIHDPDVDIVYIATPPASHRDYALACARAGKPAYVEKPMSLNQQQCQEMVRAFDKAQLPLFVAYYRRALPRFLKIRDLVACGAIGTPRFVQVTLCRPILDSERDPATLPWRVRPEISGGGHFVDLASHTLDFLDFALGPIERARGIAVNQAGLYHAEDAVAGSWQHASGVIGSGMWCFSAGGKLDENVIGGEEGKVSFATFGDGPIRLTTAQGTEEIVIGNPVAIEQPLVQTIVDELNGDGRCPSRGDSAARTSGVMDALLQGYRAGN